MSIKVVDSAKVGDYVARKHAFQEDIECDDLGVVEFVVIVAQSHKQAV